jgi:3-hydroxybutyrate dehydrogenase
MKDKVVFITGAAGGIGFAMGEKFAKAGAIVVISDMDNEKISKAVVSLKNNHLVVTGMACDVTSEQQLMDTLDKVYKLYGHIDVVINNAGVQYIAPIEAFPTEKFKLLLSVMLVAPFIATKHVFPMMKKQKKGRIINMASINGLIGFPGKAAYNSAKHGLIGLTKVTALEGAEFGITANAICPGYVDTALVRNQLADIAEMRHITYDKVVEEVIYPLVPQKRLLNVDEVANYALFLAGDNASGITGQAVVIDGGYTAQ